MIKEYAARWLSQLLGRYIKEVKAEELELSALQGDLKLKNVRLRTGALDVWNVPFSIVGGSKICELELKIPYMKLGTEPVRLVIKGLNVDLCLRKHKGSSPDEVQSVGKERIELQRKSLSRVEDQLRLRQGFLEEKKASSEGKTGGKGSQQSWWRKWVNTRLESSYEEAFRRFVVVIDDVRIRLLDGVDVYGAPIETFSFQLDRLQSETVNADNLDQSWIHKVVDIHGLNVCIGGRSVLGPSFDLKFDLQLPLYSELSRSQTGESDATQWISSVQIPDVALSIDAGQVCCIQELLEWCLNFRRFDRFRKFRPPTVVDGGSWRKPSPKEWWSFALNGVRLMIREQRMQVAQRQQKIKEIWEAKYCELYEQRCRSMMKGTACERTNQTISALEQQYLETSLTDAFELVKWRMKVWKKLRHASGLPSAEQDLERLPIPVVAELDYYAPESGLSGSAAASAVSEGVWCILAVQRFRCAVYQTRGMPNVSSARPIFVVVSEDVLVEVSALKQDHTTMKVFSVLSSLDVRYQHEESTHHILCRKDATNRDISSVIDSSPQSICDGIGEKLHSRGLKMMHLYVSSARERFRNASVISMGEYTFSAALSRVAFRTAVQPFRAILEPGLLHEVRYFLRDAHIENSHELERFVVEMYRDMRESLSDSVVKYVERPAEQTRHRVERHINWVLFESEMQLVDGASSSMTFSFDDIKLRSDVWDQDELHSSFSPEEMCSTSFGTRYCIDIPYIKTRVLTDSTGSVEIMNVSGCSLDLGHGIEGTDAGQKLHIVVSPSVDAVAINVTDKNIPHVISIVDTLLFRSMKDENVDMHKAPPSVASIQSIHVESDSDEDEFFDCVDGQGGGADASSSAPIVDNAPKRVAELANVHFLLDVGSLSVGSIFSSEFVGKTDEINAHVRIGECRLIYRGRAEESRLLFMLGYMHAEAGLMRNGQVMMSPIMRIGRESTPGCLKGMAHRRLPLEERITDLDRQADFSGVSVFHRRGSLSSTFIDLPIAHLDLDITLAARLLILVGRVVKTTESVMREGEIEQSRVSSSDVSVRCTQLIARVAISDSRLISLQVGEVRYKNRSTGSTSTMHVDLDAIVATFGSRTPSDVIDYTVLTTPLHSPVSITIDLGLRDPIRSDSDATTAPHLGYWASRSSVPVQTFIAIRCPIITLTYWHVDFLDIVGFVNYAIDLVDRLKAPSERRAIVVRADVTGVSVCIPPSRPSAGSVPEMDGLNILGSDLTVFMDSRVVVPEDVRRAQWNIYGFMKRVEARVMPTDPVRVVFTAPEVILYVDPPMQLINDHTTVPIAVTVVLPKTLRADLHQPSFQLLLRAWYMNLQNPTPEEKRVVGDLRFSEDVLSSEGNPASFSLQVEASEISLEEYVGSCCSSEKEIDVPLHILSHGALVGIVSDPLAGAMDISLSAKSIEIFGLFGSRRRYMGHVGHLVNRASEVAFSFSMSTRRSSHASDDASHAGPVEFVTKDVYVNGVEVEFADALYVNLFRWYYYLLEVVTFQPDEFRAATSGRIPKIDEPTTVRLRNAVVWWFTGFRESTLPGSLECDMVRVTAADVDLKFGPVPGCWSAAIEGLQMSICGNASAVEGATVTPYSGDHLHNSTFDVLACRSIGIDVNCDQQSPSGSRLIDERWKVDMESLWFSGGVDEVLAMNQIVQCWQSVHTAFWDRWRTRYGDDIVRRQTWNIRSTNARLHLNGDAEQLSTPLFLLEARTCTVLIAPRVESQSTVHVDLHCLLRNFNHKEGFWDMFFEPFVSNIQLVKTSPSSADSLQGDDGSTSVLCIQLQDKVNVNVSPSVVGCMQAAARSPWPHVAHRLQQTGVSLAEQRSLAEAPKQRLLRSRVPSIETVLINETGFNLDLIDGMHPGHSERLLHGHRASMRTVYEEISTAEQSISPAGDRSSDGTETLHTAVRVHIDRNRTEVWNVPLSVGMHVFSPRVRYSLHVHDVEKTPSSAMVRRHVLAHVTSVRGKRTVRLSGPVRIINDCDIPVQVLMPSKGLGTKESTINARDSIGFPVCTEELVGIYLAPAGMFAEGFGYSNTNLLELVFQYEKHVQREAHCKPKMAYVACPRTSSTTSDTPASAQYFSIIFRVAPVRAPVHVLEIVIAPPLYIENRLPIPFSVSLISSTLDPASLRSTTASKTPETVYVDIVDPGKQVPVYACDPHRFQYIDLSLAGSHWRSIQEPLLIQYPRKLMVSYGQELKLPSHCYMNGRAGDSLAIMVDNAVSHDGLTRTVTLYVTHWVVNHTTLPLQFAVGHPRGVITDRWTDDEVHVATHATPSGSGDHQAETDGDARPCPPLTIAGVCEDADSVVVQPVPTRSIPTSQGSTLPVMYSFMSKREQDSLMYLRCGSSVTQQAFSILSDGLTRYIDINMRHEDLANETGNLRRGTHGLGGKGTRLYRFGVSVRWGHGVFYRTRYVRIMPIISVVNRMGLDVTIRNAQKHETCTVVRSNSSESYYWSVEALCVKCATLPDVPDVWSSPIPLALFEGVSITVPTFSRSRPHCRVPDTTGPIFLKARSTLSHGMLVVELIDSSRLPPYIVRNGSDQVIHVKQQGGKHWYSVEPKTELPFSWEFVEQEPMLCMKVGMSQDVQLLCIDSIGLSEVLEAPIPTTPGGVGTSRLQLLVRLHHGTRVLEIENWDIVHPSVRTPLKRKREPEGPSRITADGAGRSQDTNSSELESSFREKVYSNMSLYIGQLHVSFLDSCPREIAFLSMSGVVGSYVRGQKSTMLELRLDYLQLDNQVDMFSPLPVVIQPIRDSSKANAGSGEFLRIQVIKNTESSGLLEPKDSTPDDKSSSRDRCDVFTFVGISMQPLLLELDERWVRSVVLAVNEAKSAVAYVEVGAVENTGLQLKKYELALLRYVASVLQGRNPDPIPLSKSRPAFSIMYLDMFLVEEVSIRLTFRSRKKEYDALPPSDSRSSKPMRSGALPDNSRTLRLLQKMVNVEEAPMSLDTLCLHRQGFSSFAEMLHVVKQNYREELMMQLYRIIGSLDALGNPITLVRHFGKGVSTLVSKSTEGHVLQGASGFVRHSVHGTTNMASKVTRSLASGLSKLSLDGEYRSRAQATVPRGTVEGIMEGAVAFGSGIVDGIAGVVEKPIVGFQRGQFLKGIAQGATGLVVKPVTGLLDMLSKTTEGIANSTNEGQRGALGKRIRNPRVCHVGQPLGLYVDVVQSQPSVEQRRQQK